MYGGRTGRLPSAPEFADNRRLAALVSSPYQFKAGPYSSHTLVLDSLPAEGHGRRLLDVGCAVGYLAEVLATRGFRVTGMDRCEPAGDRSFDFVEANLDGRLPPLGGRFAFIVCADVLEHLCDPLGFLQQLRILLEPDGKLVASLPNSGHAYFRWNVLLGRFPAHDRGLFDRTHLHFYTWDGWVDLFRAAGFRIKDVKVTGVPLALALPGWNARCTGFLERILFDLARAWKKMFAYQFIVTAE